LESFLERSLARARRALEKQKPDEAQKIYQSIINLYGKNPDASRAVEEAKSKLKILSRSSEDE
jgi:hypothetical protein